MHAYLLALALALARPPAPVVAQTYWPSPGHACPGAPDEEALRRREDEERRLWGPRYEEFRATIDEMRAQVLLQDAQSFVERGIPIPAREARELTELGLEVPGPVAEPEPPRPIIIVCYS
jgi:hypothetical protein